MLALLAAVENVLPPVPSDAAVALGAFLAQRGVTTPFGVFVVVWLANLAGAIGVYALARRYGRRLFATPTGRRLLAPDALAVVEREYLRWGIAAIVLGRFLPGIRAVVPPFAGLANLSVARTLVPLALASAVWYGGLTLLGTVIGSNWERLSGILGGLNRTLAVVAVVLALAGLVWWNARRRRRRRERIWLALHEAFGPVDAEIDLAAEPDETALRAAALLLLELAYADEALTPEDRAVIERELRARWGLPAPAVPAARRAVEASRERSRFGQYAARIASQFGHAQRVALVERLWTVAFELGDAAGEDQRVMRLSSELLGVDPAEVPRRRRHEPA